MMKKKCKKTERTDTEKIYSNPELKLEGGSRAELLEIASDNLVDVTKLAGTCKQALLYRMHRSSFPPS
jgi:hypothetical protein